MKLHSIAYTEYDGEAYSWQLDEFVLSNINLIVGKNATGKSRLLKIINGLARLIEGKTQVTEIASGKFKAIFKDIAGSEDRRSPDVHYTISLLNGKVVEEKLESGGKLMLRRMPGGRSELHFSKNNTAIDVQIPETHLAASVRRDATQHPFFEPLHAWAGTVKYFEFAKVENQTYSVFHGKIPHGIGQTATLENDLHLITKLGKEKYPRTFEAAVIADMRQIGYDITDFGLTHEEGASFSAVLPIIKGASPQTLFVKERDVEKKLVQREMSNGMIRALATLIYLGFTRLNKKRDCLLIDDIGEGLDFDRAKRLISVIVTEAERGFIQLVLTTNDRFIMNGVPLEYWSVMQRDKGKVSVFNEHNSAEAFAEFEQYGFNNFDFFSKKFYSKGSKKSEV
jgi:hypothetical protein